MKKFVVGLIMGLILATAVPAFAANLTAVTAKFNIKLNGEAQVLSTSPVVINGSTYLPLRATANLLGYDVDYNGTSRTISMTAKVTPVPTPISYGLTIDSDGLTTGIGSYTPGTSVRVSTTIPDGYKFTNWTNSGQIISASASFYYTMPATSVTLKANFISSAPSYGSRENPIPGINDQVITFQRYSFYSEKTIKLRLNEVITGTEANQIVQSENMFNETPNSGQEWRLFNFTLSYVSGPANDQLLASDIIWDSYFYTQTGSTLSVWGSAIFGDRYSPYSVSDVKLYPGGSSTVVIGLLVNKTEGSPVLEIPHNGGDDINWLLCSR